MADLTHLDLGPVQVLFGLAGSEVDLGQTQGGVRFTDENTMADLRTDQFGESPIDRVFSGRNVQVTIPLADVSKLANWAKVLPGATLVTNGANQKLVVRRNVGVSHRSIAGQLIIKKIVGDTVSSDPNDWITFPTAAFTASVDQVFDATTQRVLNATAMVYPDLDTGEYYFLGTQNP